MDRLRAQVVGVVEALIIRNELPELHLASTVGRGQIELDIDGI